VETAMIKTNRKKATVENGNRKNGQRETGQPENSATKTDILRMQFSVAPFQLPFYICLFYREWLRQVTLGDSNPNTESLFFTTFAKEAATCKTAKYSNIQAHHIFQPVESLGPINASGRVFFFKLGRKLADQSGDDREISFLFQRLSVLIQRYNAILLHDCFAKDEEE